MAITAQEIAELAGVSRGTVDRALKNRPGINPQTKQKILKIAREHQYKPNLIGKALAYSGHTVLVSVILNSVGNSFFDDVKSGLCEAEKNFADYGIQLQLTEIKGYDTQKLLYALEHLPAQTKSVIVTPLESPEISEKIRELTAQGIRVVTLSSDVPDAEKLAYVGCDYLKSGKIAGRLVGLLSGGRARLCIVTGSTLHTGHRMRVEGVRSVVREYPGISIARVVENNDDNATAYAAMQTVLAENQEIDFVCITAGGVTGTLQAIRESGRAIRVCSFDDTPTTRAAIKNGEILATVCQQPFEQGYNAVKSVFDAVIAKDTVQAVQYSDLYIKVDQSL